jgi:thiosulfate dehydrogenase (quinone) large subunit
MSAPSSQTNRSVPGTESRIALIGLLLVQLLVGYEWLVSGLAKIVRGGFPGGLAKELTEKSEGAPGWYRSFLDGSIIPNASAFGYLIEIGELVVGVALIGAGLIWLFRWERLPDIGRIAVLATTVIASLAAIFMAVNFHLANGAPHPWLIPQSGFDEGVDLDSLLPAVQLVLIAVSVMLWRSLRRGPVSESTSRRRRLRLWHGAEGA